jgi:hypothetical protein
MHKRVWAMSYVSEVRHSTRCTLGSCSSSSKSLAVTVSQVGQRLPATAATVPALTPRQA